MPKLIPGLTPDESQAYREAFRAPGAQTRRRVTVMDLDHNPLRSLTSDVEGGLLGGQLRWNTNADVQTEATVTFSDFDDEIDLDLRHLLRPELGVVVDGVTLWCPLITGWVQTCNDTGYESEATVHDKSAFGLQSAERGRARRGEHVGAVIKRMHAQIGETRFNIPDELLEGGPKLADAVEWGGGKPEKSVTKMSRRLAKRGNLQVFFDQAGRLTLRRHPAEPTVAWVEPSQVDVDDAVDARLLAPITWARDFSKVRNRAIGRGKRDLTAIARTKDGYAFSPESLSRGGEPLRLTHRFTDETIDRQDELRDVTEGVLKRMSVERATIQIRSTPAPWLLPHDLLHAAKRDGRATDFWMGEGGLELDGSEMTIGFVQPMRRRPRTRVSSSGSSAKEWKRKHDHHHGGKG